MPVLFFNMPGAFGEVAAKTFGCLNLSNPGEGDSANCFTGVYYEKSVLGLDFQLELNSYGYEADYKYTLFVDEDCLTSVKWRATNIELVGLVVAQLLADNLGIRIAIETINGLVKVDPNSDT